ncbi:MAG: hypothetical protein EA400_07775 [Chromatiaceae bacterium]|nr:MAG: hypothetical protein EA400_07775 [Chromatiaceae bacterium]
MTSSATGAAHAAHAVLIEALCDPAAYPHPVARVQVIETHISSILLAGPWVYKLKRPVSLGFVDLSTRAARQRDCLEELRLNRRLAPGLYRDLVPIRRAGRRAWIGTPLPSAAGGSVDALAGPLAGEFEWAVRMRRFPQAALLSARPLDQPEDGSLIEDIAARIADLHQRLPAAPADSPYGQPAAVLAPMLENLRHIRAASRNGVLEARLARLDAWTRAQAAALHPLLWERHHDGHIRECHGDLHRGNIACLDGEPLIFDALSFNPALRWIDVISEIAFLVMDLSEASRPALARRALNRYLELTGDYRGAVLLRLYLVYRALVRAKVCAIRLEQAAAQTGPDASPDASPDAGPDPGPAVGAGPAPAAGHSAPASVQDQDQVRPLRRYLALASLISSRPRPRLLLTCGLAGSGKTRLALALRCRLPLIHLRADIERKRRFGLAAAARPADQPGVGAAAGPIDRATLYSAAATAATYAQLLAQAGALLRAGCGVLVDASFLRRAARQPFLELARTGGWQCRILVLEAPVAVLEARVAARAKAGADPSDADLEVLHAQLTRREPLDPGEAALAVRLDSSALPPLEQIVRRLTGPV